MVKPRKSPKTRNEVKSSCVLVIIDEKHKTEIEFFFLKTKHEVKIEHLFSLRKIKTAVFYFRNANF